MDVPWGPHLADEVVITSGDSRVCVAPKRGGMVTSFDVGTHRVLFLDRTTLTNPALNVRGGVPFLFPNAGPLDDGRLVDTGTSLPQHGFARRNPWEIRTHDESVIELAFPLSEAIFEQYPFQFDLTSRISVEGSRLRIEAVVRNDDSRVLPVASGWHPYFFIPRGQKTALSSEYLGDEATDISENGEKNFSVPLFNTVDLAVPGQPNVALRASQEHHILQVWSPPQTDYICFEPFVGRRNALNVESQRLNIRPGNSVRLWMEIEVS